MLNLLLLQLMYCCCCSVTNTVVMLLCVTTTFSVMLYVTVPVSKHWHSRTIRLKQWKWGWRFDPFHSLATTRLHIVHVFCLKCFRSFVLILLLIIYKLTGPLSVSGSLIQKLDWFLEISVVNLLFKALSWCLIWCRGMNLIKSITIMLWCELILLLLSPFCYDTLWYNCMW